MCLNNLNWHYYCYMQDIIRHLTFIIKDVREDYMKNFIIALLFIFLSLPFQASAIDTVGIYIAPKLALNMHSFEVENSAGHKFISDDYDTTLSGSVALGYDFNPVNNIPVRAEVEYTYYGESELSGNNNIYHMGGNVKTKLNAQSLFTNIYYDFYNATQFIPYVGAGLGAALVKTSMDYNNYSGTNFSGAEGDYEANLAYNLNLGVAYQFDERLAIDLGYRFADLGESSTHSSYVNGVNLGVKSKNTYIHQISLGARIAF